MLDSARPGTLGANVIVVRLPVEMRMQGRNDCYCYFGFIA
jgi:hypothetical protein